MMRDFAVIAACGGSAGPSSRITVRVENMGPPRTFRSRLRVMGCEGIPSPGVLIPRMGRAEIVLEVPDTGTESPEDAEGEVVTSADGSPDVSVERVRFRYLPPGWHDRLDPDLCRKLADAAVSAASPSGRGMSLKDDISDEYSLLGDVKPMSEPPGRYLRVASPDEMRDFGDCTETEAAVAFMAGMLSRGYACSLVRLGSTVYVGSSEPPADGLSARRGGSGRGYVYVRPFDACRGVPFPASMDLAYSRLRSALPSKDGAYAVSGVSLIPL